MSAMPGEAVRDRRVVFIQALRGMAAMGVVLTHAQVFINGPRFLDVGERLFYNAPAGVDLFFVISGFIMAHTTWRLVATPMAACVFISKRLIRLWPVYAVGTAIMFAITRGLASPAFHPSAGDLARTLVFLPGAPQAAAPFYGYPILHPGWTLVYEVWFYVLFAVSLFAGRWRWAALGALFTTFLVVIPLVATGRLESEASVGYGFNSYLCVATNPLVWEFAVGVAIGAWYQRPPSFLLRNTRVLTTLAVLAAMLVIWQQGSEVREGHGPLRWGLPAMLLVWSLAMLDRVRTIRPPRWMIFLGDISFSLYIFHVLPQMLPRQFPTWSGMQGGGWFVAVVIAGIVLGYWGYRLLETGLCEWLRRKLLERAGPRDHEITTRSPHS
jgi:peptidoglycan/LPS O-acetylase OafA/YrhL